VLMPTQAFLRKLDPTGNSILPIADLRTKVAPHAAAFRRLVIDNEHNGEVIKLELKIYSKFYLIQPEWGDYPEACTCVECYANSCCYAACTLYSS
jgi:hypothetical protein